MSLTIDNWMVAWVPATWRSSPTPRVAKPGAVEVGPWPDRTGWTQRYLSASGCNLFERADLDLEAKIALMFIDFHRLVVLDGIDPQAAHREFLKIDEYRYRISPSIEGAEEPPPDAE